MANGEVYAQVDASVVNGGIAPMAMVSGNQEPESGQELVVVWIRWQYDDETGNGGYTGLGWFFNDEYNSIIDDYQSEELFKEYLRTSKPDNLDTVLGDWDAASKAQFITNHMTQLAVNGCLGMSAS